MLKPYKEQVGDLYKALVVEERYRRLSSVGRAEDLGDDELAALVEEAVLCILHLENRCSEKLFKLILQEMVNRCKTDAEVRASAKQVEDVLNTQVWGSADRPSQFKLGLEKKAAGEGLTLGEINLPNVRARKIIENIEPVLDVALSHNQALKESTLKACQLYTEFISIARQKEDFEDDQIEKFQDLVDEFSVLMVENYKEPFMTNYFHMLASGHVKYYMKRWKNLYRYEQQGWEAMNSLIKYYCE